MTASRSQDATVSGVRQLFFALSLDEIDNVDEDVSTPCILGISRLQPKKAFHENAYMRAIENWSTIVLQLKDILCAFNYVAYAARVAVHHDGSPLSADNFHLRRCEL